MAGPKTQSVAMTKYQALTAYLGAISMYFAFLTSPARKTDGNGTSRPVKDLRSHPLMDEIVKCRELWYKVKDLEEPEPSPEQLQIVEEGEATAGDAPQVNREFGAQDESGHNKLKRKRKTRAERFAEAAAIEAEAQRQERVRRTQEDMADLSSLLKKSRKASQPASTTTTQSAVDAGDSDFGDEVALTATEAAEKARRKKSLRFYTSQITQKANMRGAKGRTAGGDDDLPYRERLKDRQARLIEQAERRGKTSKSKEEELGGESDEEDRAISKDVRGDNGDEDDYYDMVAARAKKRKTDKASRAQAYATAEREGGKVVEVEEVGTDGKRKLTYAIEKNKGLTPFRKKDVRNPRVKKRKKYEDKKKKLSSVRQVWRGGEGKGGYGGELTGIKTGLVRSVKL
ncbi:hypothetical protein NA57DRAFT_60097 [Rhizodiscina lignyota]|uniref:Sas10 C-terminal domain-containing protein n=1 Tax=Rhizodiscina lignyota TaxID=1504668 RepID=A0A9P4M4W3_9PEZI|nr:hypothetical protein NA57DRAFT_60097 [Rhizodiscina lignyota]